MADGAGTITGEVVYLYAFDVAYEMRRQALPRLLGQPLEPLALEGDKRNPRRLALHRPLTARLPPIERVGPRGPVRIERAVKALHVGAISVAFRVPFAVDGLAELVAFHDLRFSDGSMDEMARALVEQVIAELRPLLVRPITPLPAEEAYTVFCLRADIKDATEWLAINRRAIAALLTQEPEPSQLSDAEVEESTARALSYYRQDLAVLDWDAALLIDQPKAVDELLHIIELANIELAELEAYDTTLDAAVESAYRDIAGRFNRRRRRVLRDLGELRIDLARLGDELGNITKFFGDWHLARVYQTLSDRFHLADWHRSVETKLRTLDDMYQLLKQDQNNRWMLILEITIVLLFIVDLAIILIQPFAR
jgi:hypothetical protein